MGKYALKRFYGDHGLSKPKDIGVDDRIWTTLEGGKDGRVWCLNPTNWGENRLIIREQPESISDRQILDEYDWLNPELEEEPVYVEILERHSGTIYGKILPEDQWPELDASPEFSSTQKRQNRGTVTSPEDRGTGQSVGSADSDRRKKVRKESDIRGSKNDLLK